MSDLVFCEQCGHQITANAKFCRECGAVQEMVGEPPAQDGALTAQAEDTGTRPSAGTKSPTATQTASSELAEKLDSLRSLTERELATRANAAFPGRSWQQIAGPVAGGGVAAFGAAWGIAWLILRALGDQTVGSLPFDELARFGVDLSLGAPLIISGAISSFGTETELRLPLTLLVLIPLAGLAAGGYLCAGWFRPESRTEGWKIGAMIAVPFTVALYLFGVSFGADVPLIAPSFSGSSEFGISSSSASVEIHADGFYTLIYGLFWGVLGGAFGGWLKARRTCPPGDPHAALVRTYGSSSPTVAIESAVRALGIPILGFTVLALIGCVILVAVEGAGGLLVLLALPALVIEALFLVQGVGYEAEGFVSVGGVAGEATQTTFHVWDNGIVLLVAAVLSLLVVLGLVRGGRRIVYAREPLEPAAAIRAGATIAIPWLGLLLILRGLASLSLSATGLGILQGGGKVAPAFGETILFGGLFGVVCGGLGGWLATRERGILAAKSADPDPVRTPLARKVLGDVDAPLPEIVEGPLLPARPPTPPPEPPPPPTAEAPTVADAPEPAVTSVPTPPTAVSAFCEWCGHAVEASDRFCDQCGRERTASAT